MVIPFQLLDTMINILKKNLTIITHVALLKIVNIFYQNTKILSRLLHWLFTSLKQANNSRSEVRILIFFIRGVPLPTDQLSIWVLMVIKSMMADEATKNKIWRLLNAKDGDKITNNCWVLPQETLQSKRAAIQHKKSTQRKSRYTVIWPCHCISYQIVSVSEFWYTRLEDLTNYYFENYYTDLVIKTMNYYSLHSRQQDRIKIHVT